MNLVTMNLINATDQFMILGVRLISLFSLLIRPRNISCKDKFLKFLFFKTFQALPRSQQAFFFVGEISCFIEIKTLSSFFSSSLRLFVRLLHQSSLTRGKNENPEKPRISLRSTETCNHREGVNANLTPEGLHLQQSFMNLLWCFYPRCVRLRSH